MWFKVIKFFYKVKEAIYYRIIRKFILMPFYRGSFKRCGEDLFVGRHCSLVYDHIELGDDVQIGDFCSFIATIATIHIGSHVLFGPNVTIRGGIIDQTLLDVT